MKKLLALLLLIAAPAQAADKKLYLYTWDTYMAPQVFAKFEKETGIKVVADIYSSNDALIAKLKSGAAYDVVVPSGNVVPLLKAEKLIDGDVTPLFKGTTALAVNTKLHASDVTSWKQFFEGEKQGLGVLDDVTTAMNLASFALDKKFCDEKPETLKALQEMLLKQKPAVKVYGSTGYSERLAANEIAVQMAWNGDVYRVRQQNAAIKYVYPKEGVELWTDNLAIPSSAKNKENAAAFIAFLQKPENAAVYAEAAGMMPALDAAKPLLPKAMRDAPEFNIPKGVPTRAAEACSPDVTRSYGRIWEKLTR